MKIILKGCCHENLSKITAVFICTPGQNTSDAGTQQSHNSGNSDMEDERAPSDVDTITSPGSNSENLKTGTESTTGTTDSNIKGREQPMQMS
ncbi:MAG TPA: hypothetical protein VK528_05560 [Flavobacterium sp.]|nr:hypothetical protein [Flavobacterium sp.]